MLEIDVAFEFRVMKGVLHTLFTQGDKMQPETISDEETSKRLAVPSETSLAALCAVSGGKSGLFLHAPEATYCFGFPEGGVPSLLITSDNEQGVRALIKAFSSLEVAFGFACDIKERHHRNRICRKMSYGSHEGWVGRDYNRYLPGVYWLTIISQEVLSAHNISIDALKTVAVSLEKVAGRNWLVELYSNPSEWLANSDRIDRWCESTEGVFSKQQAVDEIASALNYSDASDVFRRWR